jgi:hypothetical protein
VKTSNLTNRTVFLDKDRMMDNVQPHNIFASGRVLWYSMLNVGGNNAFVIYHSNMNPELTRRDFLKKFCLERAREHLSTRDILSNVAVDIRLKIFKVTGKGGERERP